MQSVEQLALQASYSGFESRRPYQRPAGIAKRSKAAVYKTANHRFKSVYPLHLWANAEVDYKERAPGSGQEVVGSIPTVLQRT